MNNQQKIKSGFNHLFTSTALLSASLANAQQCQSVVWEDNFDQTSLNTNAWEVMTGDGCDQGAGLCGWGNEELQSYQADNLTIANGILTIEARKERLKGTQYTSGRIRTAAMPEGGDRSFGRFEARMKIPDGQGMWPAFWMLPTNPSLGWPMSGEIDIFESVGQSANTAYGTIHYGQPWPDNSHQGGSILMQPGKWSDDFHTYAIEWEADQIRWYVDNLLYSTITSADVAPEDWPFDGRNDFHMILNLAVGGTWGGAVDDSVLPQQLEVDYVRIYAGNQPNLTGNHLPAPGSTETYQVVNPGSTTTWSVTGGTISGSGTKVDVTWDSNSADSVQTLTVISDGCEVSTPIYVGKTLTLETTLENFEGTTELTLLSSTGAYNVSGGQLTYTRDSNSQWDVIAYDTAAIDNAQPYLIGDKAFQIDVYNTDPSLIGKEILIQLEDSAVATPSNYPNGRHSKYHALINSDTGWQSLRFQLLERIDGATADSSVDTFLLLIDPNAFSGDSYVLDNLLVLSATSTPPSDPATSIIVNNVETGTQAGGKGTQFGTATVTIMDDTGQPVSGATVNGQFSGTWNETSSGITDEFGQVTILTSSSTKGTVNVSFCVSSVSSTLPLDAAASGHMCP